VRRPADLALVVAAIAACAIGACAKADSGAELDAGDGEVDAAEGVDATDCDDVWYADSDGDAHGDPAVQMIACAAPAGYVGVGDDCDDTQALAFPGGTEVCDGLDNDCSAATTEVCSSGCVVRVRPDDGRRYLFCAVAATFANAASRCAMEQFRLARVDDQTENSYLRTTTTSAIGNVNVFLGGTDGAVEGAWRWGDGAQFWQGGSGGMEVGGLYENWDSGEPNNDSNEDCVELRTNSAWNDRECGDSLPFVCERY
jgi:hypothetical protein